MADRVPQPFDSTLEIEGSSKGWHHQAMPRPFTRLLHELFQLPVPKNSLDPDVQRQTEEALFSCRRSGFSLLYGREPTEGELGIIEGRQGENYETGRRMLRRILSAVDGGDLETSFQIRLTVDDIEWRNVDGIELALDKDDTGVSRHILQGHYERHVYQLLEQTLKVGMTMVDVGANVGYHSITAARLVGPGGCVLAFEPISENVRLLLMTIDRNNLTQVHVKPFALGNKDGFAVFGNALGTNGGQLASNAASLMSSRCVIAPVRCLDEVRLDHLDLMKIDVEGAESLVLEGAAKALNRFRPTLVTEFCPFMMRRISGTSPRDFLSFLTRRGYSGAVICRDAAEYREDNISDVDVFLANYGSDHRIEDLIFRPAAPRR